MGKKKADAIKAAAAKLVAEKKAALLKKAEELKKKALAIKEAAEKKVEAKKAELLKKVEAKKGALMAKANKAVASAKKQGLSKFKAYAGKLKAKACKAILPRCASACKIVVRGLATVVTSMGVPARCIATMAKAGCIKTCNKLCSRRLSLK